MSFDAAFARTIGHEGGYVDHPSDPGGRTKFGISQRAYPSIDVAALTLDQARAIYHRDYWRAASCDSMPARLGIELFDAAVNHGVRPAVRMMQRALGVADDGVVGPVTISAAQSVADVSGLLMRFHGHRLRLLADLSTWPAFGRGWARRVARNLIEGST